jgi:hypothetical protein
MGGKSHILTLRYEEWPFFFSSVMYISHRLTVVVPWSYSSLWFSSLLTFHWWNSSADKYVILGIVTHSKHAHVFMKMHFGLSDADVGLQNSVTKSVTFAWHGGERLGTFDMGLIVASSSPFIAIIIFSRSHEAYRLNHVCHQDHFVADVV